MSMALAFQQEMSATPDICNVEPLAVFAGGLFRLKTGGRAVFNISLPAAGALSGKEMHT